MTMISTCQDLQLCSFESNLALWRCYHLHNLRGYYHRHSVTNFGVKGGQGGCVDVKGNNWPLGVGVSSATFLLHKRTFPRYSSSRKRRNFKHSPTPDFLSKISFPVSGQSSTPYVWPHLHNNCFFYNSLFTLVSYQLNFYRSGFNAMNSKALPRVGRSLCPL